MMSNHKHYSRRMGSMEEHLGNIVSKSGRDLWKSPRGTVLRIEALALVAIALSFFLAFFGSCRRWSNRWIMQKGILGAQVLSLSLGTYSIGLMQSSPVKSGMYPIWAVSLLTLFGCVDPITTYIGLDYRGPMSKMIFQLCLYFGYVMLMSVSTISSDVGKDAIILLSTITFMKSFHRALAFVLPERIRDMHVMRDACELAALAGDGKALTVHSKDTDIVTMADIQKLPLLEGTTANSMGIKDVCLSYSFSHLLRPRFLGLDTSSKMGRKLELFERKEQNINYERALKVVEVELAFLFEAFFTSNEFLHLYQAKSCFFWALASFAGICFVVATGSHHNIIKSAAAATGSPGAGTYISVNIVGTTTADQIVTLVILVSLALLQLVQLIRCLTSNWARVGIACDYAIQNRKKMAFDEGQNVMVVTTGDGSNDEEESCSSSNTSSSCNNQIICQWVMKLRLFLVHKVNCFDKYLWQARLGQDSLAALLQRTRTRRSRQSFLERACCCHLFSETFRRRLCTVGLDYLWVVVGTLLLSDTSNPGGAVSLHDDVKASITEFLGTVKSRRIGVEWSALFVENGLQDWLEYLPYTNTCESKAYAFTSRVMIWHIATWYCVEAEKAAGGNIGGGGEGGSSSSRREKNRRVAIDLSKYCTYLVVSAPELLHGPAVEMKDALDHTANGVKKLQLMNDALDHTAGFEFVAGVYLGKRLRKEAMKTPPTPLDLEELAPLINGNRKKRRRWEGGKDSTGRPCFSDLWELLALVWVQTLLYVAPYGDVQAHMQRLAHGGEFITHLWALLYHLGIDKWEVAGFDELKGAAAAAAETTAEAQVQEDAVNGGLEIHEIN